jgi:hypothetical protein
MPAPSQVSASNVNTELGVGSSTQLRWGNNWVRNVTTQYTGTNSEVNGSKMRWGINFPGGLMNEGGGYIIQYEYNSDLVISASQTVAYDGVTYAEGYSEIRFFSNGVMRLQASTTAGPTNYHKTWLTSGSAGDYTVQFQLTSGDALDGGSSAANTDLAMSTDRFFALFTGAVGPGNGIVDKDTFGNIIIKDSGGTLITRPIQLSTYAEVSL